MGSKNYDHEDVRERLEQIKQKSHISEANAQLLQEFIDYTSADSDVSCKKQHEYLGTFNIFIRDYCDKDLKEADKKDIRKAVGRLNATDYADWTVRGYKVAIKKLYRTIYEDEMDRPKRVKKILNARFMSTGTNKLEEKRDKAAYEPKEVLAMTEEADNPRDKLMPLFLFETGGRIGEIRTGIQLKDIELKQKYAEVTLPTFKNDKEPRTLVLTRSTGLLQSWLESHPDRDNSEAHLFVNIEGTNGSSKGDMMTYENMRQILKKLGQKADIDKPIRPHLFRHSAATYYGMKWSVSRLKYWLGWKDTSMAEIYCHENEDRMKKARLAEEGINMEDNNKDALDRKDCSRCGENWPPTQKYCGRCSMALDKDSAEEAKLAEESGEKIVEQRMDGMTDQDVRQRAEKLEIV